MPEIGRQVARFLNEFRRASNEFRSQIESEINSLRSQAASPGSRFCRRFKRRSDRWRTASSIRPSPEKLEAAEESCGRGSSAVKAAARRIGRDLKLPPTLTPVSTLHPLRKQPPMPEVAASCHPSTNPAKEANAHHGLPRSSRGTAQAHRLFRHRHRCRLLRLLGICRAYLSTSCSAPSWRRCTQWPFGKTRLPQSRRAFQSVPESRDAWPGYSSPRRSFSTRLWCFISPGLYRNEKRYVMPFMASTVALFLAGGYFGYKHRPSPGARLPDRLWQGFPADDHARASTARSF